MFSFFISSQLNYDNRQWPQDQPLTWFYPNFIPTQIPQLPVDSYAIHPIKEQKPLPDTQQDDFNQVEPNQVKVEAMSEQIPDSTLEKKTKVIKKKKAKQQKKKKDKVYYPNSQINVSELAQERFLQKNIQYNLLNQVFSYIWNKKKSSCILAKYYKCSESKANVFYQYFRILKRGVKRIITIQMLAKLCHFRESHPGYRTISKKNQFISILSLKEFSSGVRYLVSTYLKHYCHLSVLTSKKMRQSIRIKHLMQARKLRQYLFGNEIEQEYSSMNEEMSIEEQKSSQG